MQTTNTTNTTTSVQQKLVHASQVLSTSQQKMIQYQSLGAPTATTPQSKQVDAKAKVRWNVEPRLTIMRNAVQTVLNGANTTEVAGRFGIPARTLRRYVANAKRRHGDPHGSKKLDKNNKVRKKVIRKKINGTHQMIEMNLGRVNTFSDAPIAGEIPPLLRSNEMETLGKKRTRTTSLELFLQAIAPVPSRHKTRGNSDNENSGSSSVTAKHAAAFKSSSHNNNNNNNNNVSSSSSSRTSSVAGLMTGLATQRDRLDSFTFSGSLGGMSGSGGRSKIRKNSIEIFKKQIDESIMEPESGLPITTSSPSVKEGDQLKLDSVINNAPKIGLSDMKGLFTPRYRSNSIDFNATQDKDVFMSDFLHQSLVSPSSSVSPKTAKSRSGSRW